MVCTRYALNFSTLASFVLPRDPTGRRGRLRCSPVASDDAGPHQPVDVLAGHGEELGENLARVLAVATAGPTHPARGCGELRHDAGERDGSQIVVRRFDEHLARLVVGVGEDVSHG